MTNPASLLQYLDADLISLRSEIGSRKKLLQETARLLSTRIADAREKDVYHLLLEREKLGSTGIGNGVALPHSRCSDAERAIIAIITLQEPVDYHSPDRQPVDTVFGLLVPESATEEHLGLLAAIASIMSDDAKKDHLLRADTASGVIQLIKDWAEASS